MLPDGIVTWYPTGRFLTYCEVDAYQFPFDRQDCKLTISNFRSPATHTNFTPDHSIPVIDNQTIFSNEWTLIESKVVNNPILNNGRCMSNIDYILTLKRVPNYYVITIIVPIALLSCVNLMVFPLPAQSGEKINLSMACLMAFFLMQVNISQNMPTNFETTPVIGK